MDEYAQNAFLDKLGYLPVDVMQYQRVAVHGLLYHIQQYNRCKKMCNSYLKSSCGLHIALDLSMKWEMAAAFCVESLSVSNFPMCPTSTYANTPRMMWCCCTLRKYGGCASPWLLVAICMLPTCQMCMNRTNG